MPRRCIWLLLIVSAGCAASGQERGEPAAAEAHRADVTTVNSPGAWVDIDMLPVRGKVTVVEFYADWCRPCKRLEKQVIEAAVRDAQLAVRKIHIGAADSEVADVYDIQNLPYVLLYDAAGSRRYELRGAQAQHTVRLASELLRESRVSAGSRGLRAPRGRASPR